MDRAAVKFYVFSIGSPEDRRTLGVPDCCGSGVTFGAHSKPTSSGGDVYVKEAKIEGTSIASDSRSEGERPLGGFEQWR